MSAEFDDNLPNTEAQAPSTRHWYVMLDDLPAREQQRVQGVVNILAPIIEGGDMTQIRKLGEREILLDYKDVPITRGANTTVLQVWVSFEGSPVHLIIENIQKGQPEFISVVYVEEVKGPFGEDAATKAAIEKHVLSQRAAKFAPQIIQWIENIFITTTIMNTKQDSEK